MVTPVQPLRLALPTAPLSQQSSTKASGAAGPTTTSRPADPCVPTDPAVIAACLRAPWGLAPLPDGTSALVGERSTGVILRVSAGKKPTIVTTIADIDASGDGGLLGIAISPSYNEDGLIYAYVTTKADNRVIRLATGDNPKPIVTGIPKGAIHNGGALAFDTDGRLYIGTGDAGVDQSPASLGGKLLRVDDFGKPAAGNPKADSPIFSTGLTQPASICVLPTSAMAAIDHRRAADVLLLAKSGKNYSTLFSGDAIWTWQAGEGGAAGCASSAGLLANTSLAGKHLAGISMSATGVFSGTPRVLLADTYGRLLTLQPGTKKALWMTTSNKDGAGKPIAADDRVILLPDAGSSGGGGPQ